MNATDRAQQDNDADGGLHTCDFGGCGKTFTRRDHLVRHAMNHRDTSYFCGTCRRGFKRQDLLQRHERRNVCNPPDGVFPSPLPPKKDADGNIIKGPRGGMHLYGIKRGRPDDDDGTPRTGGLTLAPVLSPHDTFPGAPTSAGSLTSASLYTSSEPPTSALGPPLLPPQHQAPTQTFTHGSSLSSHSTLVGPVDSQQSQSQQVTLSPTTQIQPGSELDHPAFARGRVQTDFEFLPAWQDWTLSAWPSEPWDALLQDATFFSEPTLSMDIPWTIPTTPRVQESSERAQEDNITQALVAKLAVEVTEFNVTTSYLTETLASYWENVAPSFPFIHRGTLDINEAPSDLVIMMAVIGSVHMASPRPNFRPIVARIRGKIVAEFKLDMTVEMIQTMCLCHVHDTWYGTSESQFVAQCVWPTMVSYARKKGIGVIGRSETDLLGEAAWSAWAKDEERRRAAYCILCIDTQISAFWNQHPSRQLSIFAHNLANPCSRTQWEAATAAEWSRTREPPNPPTPASRKARLGFHPGLHPDFHVDHVTDGYSASVRKALAAESKPMKVDLDSWFTGYMILMGLMAVAWDCRTRGGVGIRVPDFKRWRGIVVNAVIALRAQWESSTQSTVVQTAEMKDMRDSCAIAIISTLSDIPMLQAAAGATQICGASIGPRQYQDAQRRLRIWGKTDDAWSCLWQSARYLRIALISDWGVYTSWAVYLSTLVHWAYAWTMSRESDRTSQPAEQPQQTLQNALNMLDMIMASAHRPESLDFGASDLIALVAEKLLARGEIEQEHGLLLGRLVERPPPSRRRRYT